MRTCSVVENTVGMRFGKLVVLGHINTTRSKHNPKRIIYEFDCICDCGNRRVATREYLIGKGRNKSCYDCSNLLHSNKCTLHGLSRDITYNSYISMIYRCTDNSNSNFKSYGGRGIKVCDRWLESIENFVLDMGLRPSNKHSIDRIDVNGDYEQNNCKWSNNKEQSNNRRNTIYFTLDGVTKSLSEWSHLLDIPTPTLISRRLRSGWDDNKCLTTPIDLKRTRRKTKEI